MVKKPVLALFLALAGCLAQTARNPQDANTGFIALVRERLREVRQIETLGGVPIVLQTKGRAAGYIDTSLQTSSDGRSLEETSLAYAKLGLLPLGVDLKDHLREFYASQATAFYDSTAKKIFLSVPDHNDQERLLGEHDEKIIAHELVHAYQDQRFSIGNGLRAEGNSDAALALRSVAEGDAVLSEYAYVFGGLDHSLPSYMEQLLDAGTEASNLAGLPMIVSDKVRFQYDAGVRFVGRALKSGGWLSVDRLFQAPPLSTEQILHPEKYFEAPDPPTRIEFNSLSQIFPSPWKMIENDTLGELSVHCLVNQFIGSSAATVVAQGWDGDRFVAYRKGDEFAFIWATIWDSSADAEEFYRYYHQILELKYGPHPASSASYVEKRGAVVLVIEGIERQEIKRHIDSVWSHMVIREAPFQPPFHPAAMAIRQTHDLGQPSSD